MDLTQIESDDNCQFLSVPPPSPHDDRLRFTRRLRKSRKNNQRNSCMREKKAVLTKTKKFKKKIQKIIVFIITNFP